jgi:hypothetical protein
MVIHVGNFILSRQTDIEISNLGGKPHYAGGTGILG